MLVRQDKPLVMGTYNTTEKEIYILTTFITPSQAFTGLGQMHFGSYTLVFKSNISKMSEFKYCHSILSALVLRSSTYVKIPIAQCKNIPLQVKVLY